MNDNTKSMAFSCGAAAVSTGHTNEPTAFDKAWGAICRAYSNWVGETANEEVVAHTTYAAQPARQNHAA